MHAFNLYGYVSSNTKSDRIFGYIFDTVIVSFPNGTNLDKDWCQTALCIDMGNDFIT